jgi:hypothetical protein
MLIAGNSNVIADAVHNNVAAIYYWTGDIDYFDFYGLVSAYEIDAAESAEEVLNLFNKK